MTGQDMERRIPVCCFEYCCYAIRRNCNPELADSLIFNFVPEEPMCRVSPVSGGHSSGGSGALP